MTWDLLAEELTEDVTRELSQNAYFNVIAASAIGILARQASR
jgi:TolB-like protein